jgi:hypothetical protein
MRVLLAGALLATAAWSLAAAALPFPMPQGLQGHDDENWPSALMSPTQTETPALAARYANLAKLKPGIRRYNMMWGGFETTPSASTAAGLHCPAGSEVHPPSASDMAGFKKFHCYDTAALKKFDLIFELDRSIGAQGAAILYSAPAFYIEPNCTGFVFGKDVIKGGCAPRDDAMDDYEDFVNLLAARYSPHLKHYIVWNEVASAGWMDCSPHTPNRAGPGGESPLTDGQFDYWVSKYATLVRRTQVAAARHSNGEHMIWTSNDRLWERPKQGDGEPLHTGVRPFLDRLWPKLGINFTWNLAVHPYDGGNPMDDHEFAPGFHPQAYTFATLGHAAHYQTTMAVKAGATSTQAEDFSHLYASEQGWPSPACCVDTIRGRNICYAHALSADSESAVIGVTHNFFHDSPGGSEQGGQDYGLIPGNISGDLSNGTGWPTFDAYNSTSQAYWGRSDGHYCCSKWSMGCKVRKTPSWPRSWANFSLL